MNKIEFLFNRLRLAKCSELINNLVCLIAQILRLLRRYFNPEKLMLHYKKLILFTKQTSKIYFYYLIIYLNFLFHKGNSKILNEILSIWTDPNFSMYKDNKDILLPILKKVNNFILMIKFYFSFYLEFFQFGLSCPLEMSFNFDLSLRV